MSYTEIDDPTIYFNTKLYTGNGSTGHAITGVGFQPDFLWLKPRSTTGYHRVFDVVRGAGKQIYPNETNQENTDTNQMSSFNSDGFTLGNETGSNANGTSFVSWNWKANGAGSANTDGSITSTVSANTTSGFSIVSYTGTGSLATVGHGLGVAPKVILYKNRTSGSTDWGMYHTGLGSNNSYMSINTTNAVSSSTNRFNNTAPTSSVYTINTHATINESSSNFIAYCFADKKGYSKFGSYTGNGNADGTFVYLGFKPAFVIFKNSTGANNWNMRDNKRNTYNPTNKNLYPNNSNAEDTAVSIDFVSNGFKLRDSADTWNGSGNTYIYMAFAENPFVTSGGIPTTAR